MAMDMKGWDLGQPCNPFPIQTSIEHYPITYDDINLMIGVAFGYIQKLRVVTLVVV
jgi:hypothetical protein